MIIQMLLGGLAALAVSIKMFGKKVVRTLAFWKKDEAEAPSPAEKAGAEQAKPGKGAVKETV